MSFSTREIVITLPADCRSLAELAPGEHGQLCEHPEHRGPHRLRELGFVSGTTIQIVRRAPLGDPVEVEIRGARICVRHAELAMFSIARPIESP